MKLVSMVGVVFAAGSLVLGGCQSKGGTSYDIQISVGDDVGESTQVQVYLKGYADSEYAPLAMAGEFQGESLRELIADGGQRAEWQFISPGEGRSKMLSRNDDEWMDWRSSANWIVVMARVGVGTYDSLSLPLAKDKWESREISIVVGSNGLDLKTKQVVN